MATYTVVKGDNLTKIARAYGTTVSQLVAWNGIKNPNYIVVGQVLNVSEDSSGGSSGGSSSGGSSGGSTSTSSVSSRVTIDVFGLQSDTDRTVYATWSWSQSNTENYEVYWYYDTGDNVWFVGSNTNEKDNQSLYNAPQNAKRVKFKVKPISKTRRVNNNDVSYWTASWSTEKTYDFSNNPPVAPGAPSVKMEKTILTAELENIDLNATSIQFQIVKDNSTVFNTGTATITTNHARYSCTIAYGSEYKVRCRACRGDQYSNWSEYSTVVVTPPSTPTGITEIKAKTKTSVYLTWDPVNTATAYDIEYATKREYFDITSQTTTVNSIEGTAHELIGLEMGYEYFFRVRAVNSSGSSNWSEIASVIVGKDPVAPTTWSSTTTCVVKEPLKLYWVHNSADGSSQTYAELELTVGGLTEVLTIKNTENEDEKDKTSVYEVDTSTYTEGTKLEWRVRTKGVTDNYGEWSIMRTVDIYAPVVLEFSVVNANGELFDTLESFPMHVSALGGPETQTPIGYHLTITANEVHETIDYNGNSKLVNKGESVYSKHFDVSDVLTVDISAWDVRLENNVEYIITCVVSMNSGLTESSSIPFKVSWTDDIFEPNAEIGIDHETLTAFIRPVCDTEDVSLSVYRREFDGTFTELATGIVNGSATFITDPHPALDYARYRIVAISNTTGVVSYYDVPGYPVGEHAAVIQWDEEWLPFDASGEDGMEKPVWSGSMLKLLYNLDISEKYNHDVSQVAYIGRENPVSYHGTQVGHGSTWSVDVPMTDKETLHAIRRLARWMGNVYVREPSGTGYWATVSVSYNKNHCEVVIPVTLDITRVEGGV